MSVRVWGAAAVAMVAMGVAINEGQLDIPYVDYQPLRQRRNRLADIGSIGGWFGATTAVAKRG